MINFNIFKINKIIYWYTIFFYKLLLNPFTNLFIYLGIIILTNIYTYCSHENHFTITYNDIPKNIAVSPDDYNTTKTLENTVNDPDDQLTIGDLLFFYDVAFKDPSEMETDNIQSALSKQIDIERAIIDNIIHRAPEIDIQILWENFHNTISGLPNNEAIHQAMNYVKNNLPNDIWLAEEGSRTKLTVNSLLKQFLENVTWYTANELRSMIFFQIAISLQQKFVRIHYTCEPSDLEALFMHHVHNFYDDHSETIIARFLSLYA